MRVANFNCVSVANGYSYIDDHAQCHANCHIDGDRHSHSYAYGYCYRYRNCDFHCNSYCEADAHSEARRNTEGAPYPSAETTKWSMISARGAVILTGD